MQLVGLRKKKEQSQGLIKEVDKNRKAGNINKVQGKWCDTVLKSALATQSSAQCSLSFLPSFFLATQETNKLATGQLHLHKHTHEHKESVATVGQRPGYPLASFVLQRGNVKKWNERQYSAIFSSTPLGRSTDKRVSQASLTGNFTAIHFTIEWMADIAIQVNKRVNCSNCCN